MTVALWLIPGEETRARVAAIIDRLSAQYSAPRFSPHVTLLHPIARDVTTNQLAALVDEVSGLELVPEQVGTGADRYHCVFLSIRASERLLGARRLAQQIFSAAASPFMPHMSLIYAHLEKHERQEIAGHLADFPRDAFPVAAIEAVDCAGRVEDWRVIARASR